MGAELSSRTFYDPFTLSERNFSLASNANFSRRGKADSSSLQGAFDDVEGFGLPKIAQKQTGRAVVSLYYGSVDLPNFQRKGSFFNLGFAIEYSSALSPNRQKTVNSVIMRRGLFEWEDFEDGYYALKEHRSVQRPLWAACGVGMGYVLTLPVGDPYIGASAAISGAAVGWMASQKYAELNNHDLRIAVPDRGEYFADISALDRIKAMQDHRVTVEFMNRMYEALEKRGVYAPPQEVVDIWGFEMGSFRTSYNYLQRFPDTDRVRRQKAKEFDKMVDFIAARIRL